MHLPEHDLQGAEIPRAIFIFGIQLLKLPLEGLLLCLERLDLLIHLLHLHLLCSFRIPDVQKTGSQKRKGQSKHKNSFYHR